MIMFEELNDNVGRMRRFKGWKWTLVIRACSSITIVQMISGHSMA